MDAVRPWQAEVRAAMVRAAKATLERLLEHEAAEMARLRDHRRYGYQLSTVWFDGLKIDNVSVPRISVPDGIRTPPLYAKLQRLRNEETIRLSQGGHSARTLERDARREGRGTDGRSSSNVQRVRAVAQLRDYKEMMSRRFDKDAIVAVSLDGTAVGRRATGYRTVVVATGLLADGRRKVLGAVVGPTESAELVGTLVQSIVDRGVDRRVLWIADQGQGIRAAVEGLFPEEDARPTFQVCTVHKSRNVATHLRPLGEKVQEEIRRRMYTAWGRDDADQALAELGEIAADLRARSERMQAAGGAKAGELGRAYAAAASSLETNMADTVTVIRLGLSKTLRRQLRTTNGLEAANYGLKQMLARVTNWNQGSRRVAKFEHGVQQRLNWTAEAFMYQERHVWARTSDTEGLIALHERLMPDGPDLERLRDVAPPLLTVDRISVPVSAPGKEVEEASERPEQERTREMAGEVLRGEEGIALGFGPALIALGLDRGQTVDADGLALALQGRTPTGGQVRRVTKVAGRQPNADGTVEKVAFDGVAGARWSFVAPRRVGELWQSQPERRAELERAVLASAEAAVERVTRTTAPDDGFAAVGRFSARETADGIEIRVDGALLGIKRGAADLSTPAVRETFTSPEARRAEDVAAKVLTAAIGPLLEAERAEREQALAAARRAGARDGGPSDPLTRQRRKTLGDSLVGRIEARAETLEAALADSDDDLLRARRRALGDVLRQLDGFAVPAAGLRKLRDDWHAARGDLRRALEARAAHEPGTAEHARLGRALASAERRLDRIGQTGRALQEQGRDVRLWLRETAVGPDGRELLVGPAHEEEQAPMTNIEAVARVVALERTAAERGIDLGADPAVERDDRERPAIERSGSPDAGAGF